MVMPDTRAVSLKGVGNQTINTRVKTGPASVGSVIEDTMQGHYHYNSDTYNATGFGSYKLTYSNATGVFTLSNQGNVLDPGTDTVNGTPRTGAQTQDCTIGTNFGITY
jgi:hypothetical protein